MAWKIPSPRWSRLFQRYPALSPAQSTALVLAGLTALLCVVFPAAVFSNRVFFERDIHLFWDPQIESFVRVVTAPAWPLWNPYASFGQPLLADPSAQVLYPPTWLNLLMLPGTYFTVFVIGHIAFAGLGVFRLVRAWGLSATAAAAGASLWVCSGPLLSLGTLWHHLSGAAWMPWVLYAAETTAQTKSTRRAVLWGLLAAGQVLAGSAEMCALTHVAAVILIARHLSLGRLRDSRRLAVLALLAGSLAVALTAALWLPTLDFALRSARRALPLAVRTFWSLHPFRLAELIAPVSWRNVPATGGLAAAVLDGREPFIYSIYLGMPSVALWLACFQLRRTALRTALLITGGVTLLLALGRHTPFYAAAVTLCPPARVFRYPEKAMILVALCAALLGALGIEAWLSTERNATTWRRWVTAPLVPLACMAWLGVAALRWRSGQIGLALLGPIPSGFDYGAILAHARGDLVAASVMLTVVALLSAWRPRARQLSALAALVTVLVVADLVRQHRDLNPTAPPSLYAHRPRVLDLVRTTDHARLYAYDYLNVRGAALRYLGHARPYEPAHPPDGWAYRAAEALAQRDALAPPLAAAWARESSFDLDSRALYPKELEQLTRQLRAAEGTPAHLQLLRIGAVSHVLALHARGFEDLTPVDTLPSVTAEPIRVFQVPNPLPRTYAVADARIADGDDAVRVLVDPTFDPRRTIVLPTGQPPRASTGFVGTSRIAEFSPDRVRLQATLSSAGYVVLVDTFDPGWRATVDRRPTPLLRANAAFRAVPVPAGQHEVVMVYRPRSVLWGLAISAAAIVATLAHFAWRPARPARIA